MAEQRVPLWTANQFKQMRDEDMIVFHHKVPPFLARRMSWLKHPILRERQAMRPPPLSQLPPLDPFTLAADSQELGNHHATTSADSEGLINPGDFE